MQIGPVRHIQDPLLLDYHPLVAGCSKDLGEPAKIDELRRDMLVRCSESAERNEVYNLSATGINRLHARGSAQRPPAPRRALVPGCTR
jgi:hypothetical protein